MLNAIELLRQKVPDDINVMRFELRNAYFEAPLLSKHTVGYSLLSSVNKDRYDPRKSNETFFVQTLKYFLSAYVFLILSHIVNGSFRNVCQLKKC